jgi:hypothetical protein
VQELVEDRRVLPKGGETDCEINGKGGGFGDIPAASKLGIQLRTLGNEDRREHE